MARDGSGNYTRVAGPYVGGTTILKDNINDELDDVADALTDSINTAGTKAFGANQPMGGFKLTGLGAGVVNGDSVRFEQVQPIDAMLTGLAGLDWTVGRPLIEVTADDTPALTLTPSVQSVTATETTAATHAVVAKNTADAAAVAALRIEGDRATPANNDEVYESYYLSDDAGNQDEIVRITAKAVDVTSGSEDGRIVFSIAQSGVITEKLWLHNTGVLGPVTNDGLTLGSATIAWSDLFLASGGVVNWNNGDVVMTHSANALEVTGGGFAAPLLQVSGVGGETLAAATHRNRMLLLDGDITIDDGTFAAGDCGVMIADGTDRTVTRAAGLTMYVNGVDSATATIPAHTVAGFATESSTVIHLTGSAF